MTVFIWDNTQTIFEDRELYPLAISSGIEHTKNLGGRGKLVIWS